MEENKLMMQTIGNAKLKREDIDRFALEQKKLTLKEKLASIGFFSVIGIFITGLSALFVNFGDKTLIASIILACGSFVPLTSTIVKFEQYNTTKRKSIYDFCKKFNLTKAEAKTILKTISAGDKYLVKEKKETAKDSKKIYEKLLRENNTDIIKTEIYSAVEKEREIVKKDLQLKLKTEMPEIKLINEKLKCLRIIFSSTEERIQCLGYNPETSEKIIVEKTQNI